MGNNERLSDRDDPRLYTPLRPDDDPDEVASKLATKRAAMAEAMKIYGKRQAAQAAQRALARKKRQEEEAAARQNNLVNHSPKLTYEDNPIGYGWMTKNVDEPKLVSHTAKTDHFFRYNEAAKAFELAYQGSADIVSFLEMHLAVDKLLEKESGHSEKRPLAFFDKKGRFHDRALLQKLDVHLHDVDGTLQPKHTAIFMMPHNGKHYETAVAIDNIYCLSLARPEIVEAEQLIKSPEPI